VLIIFVAVNRLDRLTSGLMVLGLSSQRASDLSREFRDGSIKKEYIARCKGEFPAYVFPLCLLGAFYSRVVLLNSEEITCDQPLLTIDRQMGLNIVHPDGKVMRASVFSFFGMIERATISQPRLFSIEYATTRIPIRV
jgi:23S rRNA-/tRNA-specific pseudouridylate synthase